MNDMNNQLHEIDKLSPELERGPLWLRDKRHSAREAFNEQPLPQRGLHLWRYTDPSMFLLDKDSVSDTSFGENYDRVEKAELQHLADGHLSGLVSDFAGRKIVVHGADKLAKDSVVVCALSEAIDKHQDLVEPYLYQLVNASTGKFEAMNGALWNDGIFVYVPKNKTIEKPLHLLREAGLDNSAQFPRLLVVADENAELTIIDEYGGGSQDFAKSSYANGAAELFGKAHSRVRYVNLQRYASGMNSYFTHRARLENSANMLTIMLTFGGLLSKQNFGVTLGGANAESNMYGLAFGSGRQHMDSHTLHEHAVGQTLSNIDYKVVLADKALSAYTGLIKIDKSAKTCEAYQENRNLLLNKGTRAETIPELEILNEDVRCSHGATIGPIDPMELFYLGSRGIEHETATRMIVGGFVEKTLKLVPGDLTERIRSFVAQRLEGLKV